VWGGGGDTRRHGQVVDHQVLLQSGALARRRLGRLVPRPLLVHLPPRQLRVAAAALKVLVRAPQRVQVLARHREGLVVRPPAHGDRRWDGWGLE